MSQNFDPNQNYYFFDKKNSTPVVFIHGVGLDHQMWNKQVDYLSEFSILTYDLLGHGKTPFNKDKLNLKDFSFMYILTVCKIPEKKRIFRLMKYPRLCNSSHMYLFYLLLK